MLKDGKIKKKIVSVSYTPSSKSYSIDIKFEFDKMGAIVFRM